MEICSRSLMEGSNRYKDRNLALLGRDRMPSSDM